MTDRPVVSPLNDACLLRLLRLEQRIGAYDRLHAEELRELRAEIEQLKRAMIARERSVQEPAE